MLDQTPGRGVVNADVAAQLVDVFNLVVEMDLVGVDVLCHSVLPV